MVKIEPRAVLPPGGVEELTMAEEPRRPAGKRATILIVDDDEMVRSLSTLSLQSEGYRTLVANNGREGLETFRTQKDEIDLVILDWVMPLMDGRETFIALRELEPDVRILVCSGFLPGGFPNDLLGPRTSVFLQKPFTFPNLLAAVEKALQAE